MGLHCEPLPASTSFSYFRQGQSNSMSIPAGNGTTGASGTGPALGYTLNLFWFIFLFILISKNNMNTCTYLIHTLSLIYAMKLPSWGCNFYFSFEGLNASFSEFGSELQKCITNHRKIVKMQTHMFWNRYTEICRNHTHFNL